MTQPTRPSLRRFTHIILTLAAFVCLTASRTTAWSPGRLSGTVVDPAGAGVPNARVLVRDKAGVIVYEAKTDGSGTFSVSDVSPGTYTVAVEAEGMAQPEKTTVQVESGAGASVSIKLAIAALSDQLVVTATRTETPADELGGSISVATSEDIQRANQSLVSDPLRLMPGVAVVQTGGRGGLTSVFTRGGDSNFNKVLIDGVPVNLAGGSFDFSDLTPENLDRIEVVRGPQSALFGSDAMTSVIQLVTRRGTTSVPEFELSGEGGSFDFHRETARLSGLVGLFDYSTSFGFQATAGRFRNSDFTNRSLSSNFGFRLPSEAQLRITARWNGDTLGVPGPTAALFADPDERQKHHDLALAATLDLRTTSRWHNSVRFIYSESETHSFDPAAQDLTVPGTPLLPPGAFGDDFVSDFTDHEKRSGVHYQSIASLGRSNVLTAGIDFEHESAVFTNSVPPQSRVSPERNDIGIYVQDQAAWRDRLFASGGVRIERNSGRVPGDFKQTQGNAPIGDVGFGWTANPKLAVSFLARRHRESGPLGSTRLKASFGTGIKEPTLLEAFSPDPTFIGNPALNPERAISYEAGIAQEFFGRKASVEVTYFDNRFRDLVLFEETPSFGPIELPDGRLANFFNAARSSARGIELVATARPARGVWSHLRMTGSYTFLRTRLDESADILAFPPPTFQAVLVPDPEIGLPLLRRPRNSGTFLLSWIDRRFDLNLTGSIVGRRRDFDPVTFSKFDASGLPIFNDGYARLDASGSLEVTRNLRAFVRIENLLNQDYQEVLGFPAYRLNFSAGLRIRIGGKR